MNDSRDFQDAESVPSGNSHVTSQPVSFPPHLIPEWILRHFFVSSSRREGPPSIWDTLGISGNDFVSALSSRIASMELIERRASPFVHREKEQNQDLRCQSGQSASDSVIFSGGDYSKNYGAVQRLQILGLHFDKFQHQQPFACWKMRFKTEVCACSQFPTEAKQWIKEMEMVDSVND